MVPKMLAVRNLDPIVVEEPLHPVTEHTHIAIHGDEKYVEVVPAHASSPPLSPSLLPTPALSIDGIVAQILAVGELGPVVVEEPVFPVAVHKHIAVHGEEDFIEVVPTAEYTGLREGATKMKDEVAERALGDCKPGSWGC
jgi:hypothetical protein